MNIKPEENVFITPVGLVNFYTLDAPFGAHTAECDEKGKVTNGKLGIRVELDASDKAVMELLTALKGNVSVKKIVKDDNSIIVQLSAGTKFKPDVAGVDGRIIDAPTDVRINAGDVMKVTLSISEYSYEFEGKKSKALRLNAVKILDHDISKRVVVEGEATGGKATFLDALNNTQDKLAALKG